MLRIILGKLFVNNLTKTATIKLPLPLKNEIRKDKGHKDNYFQQQKSY